jgi:hypothetical protein
VAQGVGAEYKPQYCKKKKSRGSLQISQFSSLLIDLWAISFFHIKNCIIMTIFLCISLLTFKFEEIWTKELNQLFN